MANKRNVNNTQYWLKNETDKKIEDYSKLIKKPKVKIVENLIENFFKNKVVNNKFIVPEKPFYFDMVELLEKGTVKASINKPSRDFNRYAVVKKISNNLDSFSTFYSSYCYNDNPMLHKGIFIYYFFSNEAKPVPLVFDYNSMEYNEELTISFIKLSELSYLIESEEDVVTVEKIVESVKDNVENYVISSEDPEEEAVNINFIGSIIDVIEDFSGRKKIDLLAKYDVNEIDSSLAEDLSNYEYVTSGSITTEDIFKLTLQQNQEIKDLNSKLESVSNVINELDEIHNRIKELDEEPSEKD